MGRREKTWVPFTRHVVVRVLDGEQFKVLVGVGVFSGSVRPWPVWGACRMPVLGFVVTYVAVMGLVLCVETRDVKRL